MAHFAELDGSNSVLRVVVISNDIETAAGPLGDNDGHVDGETWCKDFFGQDTNWKQTSYNNNFRKQYAGRGMIYDPVKDKFIQSTPFPSWTLDENDDWQAPVAKPTGSDLSYDYGDGTFYNWELNWDEGNQRWIANRWSGGTGEMKENPDATPVFWNTGTSTWDNV